MKIIIIITNNLAFALALTTYNAPDISLCMCTHTRSRQTNTYPWIIGHECVHLNIKNNYFISINEEQRQCIDSHIICVSLAR